MKFSIVTPSLNQGSFLAKTLESVAGQTGIDVEHIVLDAGSTDRSVEIIKAWDGRLAYWRSHPDAGQAAAINEGFGRATGQVLAWLNSDDFYLPGTLAIVARAFTDGAEAVYGGCLIYEEGRGGAWGFMPPKFGTRDLTQELYISQPAVFVSRQAWLESGPLDEKLHYTFDWDWLVRLSRVTSLTKIPRYLAAIHTHGDRKSLHQGHARRSEVLEVVRRYASQDTIACYEAVDRKVRHTWETLGTFNSFRGGRFIRSGLTVARHPVLYRKWGRVGVEKALASLT